MHMQYILFLLLGNIRVFCRVRPLLSTESASAEGLKLEYPDEESDGRKLVLSYPPSEVCIDD